MTLNQLKERLIKDTNNNLPLMVDVIRGGAYLDSIGMHDKQIIKWLKDDLVNLVINDYYTKKEKLEERGLNDLTDSEIYEALKQEVKTYDQYLTGDIYHYSILNSENEVIDSCGGFYGFDDTLTECKAIIDQLNNKE